MLSCIFCFGQDKISGIVFADTNKKNIHEKDEVTVSNVLIFNLKQKYIKKKIQHYKSRRQYCFCNLTYRVYFEEKQTKTMFSFMSLLTKQKKS